MEKKIILMDIFEEYRQKFIKQGMNYPDWVILAMKEACRKSLELAAEEAETENIEWALGTEIIVYKKSILDVINLIE